MDIQIPIYPLSLWERARVRVKTPIRTGHKDSFWIKRLEE
jgi:hypothetical protein